MASVTFTIYQSLAGSQDGRLTKRTYILPEAAQENESLGKRIASGRPLTAADIHEAAIEVLSIGSGKS